MPIVLWVLMMSYPKNSGPKLTHHLAMTIQLTNLAEMWEADITIRQRARQALTLIQWPNPQAVGIPSMILVFEVVFFIVFL